MDPKIAEREAAWIAARERRIAARQKLVAVNDLARDLLREWLDAGKVADTAATALAAARQEQMTGERA